MKKYNVSIVIAVMLAFVGFSSALAQAQTEGSGAVPVTVSSDSSEDAAYTPAVYNSVAPAVAPSTQVSNSNEAAAIIPTSSGSTSNEAPGIVPASQGSNGAEGDTSSPVTPPSTPTTPSNNGGGGGVAASFLGGGGSGSVVVATSAIAPLTGTSSCPLVSTFMKLGNANNSSDVAKLQAFLKDSQGLNVSVTGTFDVQTETAVKAFQAKFMSEVMGPWDATRTSGIVYITTMKKINELACSQPLTLTPSEMAIINAYKQNVANGTVTAPSQTTIGPVLNSDSSATTSVQLPSDVGQASDQNGNTAAVGNASIIQRFWSFIKNIF